MPSLEGFRSNSEMNSAIRRVSRWVSPPWLPGETEPSRVSCRRCFPLAHSYRRWPCRQSGAACHSTQSPLFSAEIKKTE